MSQPLLPFMRIAIAAAFGTLLICGRDDSPPPPPRAPVAPAWATDIEKWPQADSVLAVPPTGPMPGQKKPPCKPRVEREVAGACWVPHIERPPCPDGLYESEGICLMPVKATQGPPTSLGR